MFRYSNHKELNILFYKRCHANFILINSFKCKLVKNHLATISFFIYRVYTLKQLSLSTINMAEIV